MKLANAKALLKRAEQLRQKGNSQLALHLVDFVIKGSKYGIQRKKTLLVKSQLLDARADTETNQIAWNILLAGAEEAEQIARTL